jgi:hypothetical protein
MKISQDIRALLMFLVAMGVIGGIVIMAMVTAPVINRYPQVSLRIIVAIFLTFVSLKFLFYIAEAVLVVIGKKSSRVEQKIRSAHPMMRRALIIGTVIASFAAWYFVFAYIKGLFR